MICFITATDATQMVPDSTVVKTKRSVLAVDQWSCRLSGHYDVAVVRTTWPRALWASVIRMGFHIRVRTW